MPCQKFHTRSWLSLGRRTCDAGLPSKSGGTKCNIPWSLITVSLGGIALITLVLVDRAMCFETGGRKAVAVRVPFVGCYSEGQAGPQPAPTGTEMAVRIDARAAESLAYYKAENFGVLAPRGWYCFGLYDSAVFSLFVAPQPIKGDDLYSATERRRFTGPIIELFAITSEASGRFHAARIMARVFPAKKAFVQKIIQEELEPASDFPFGPYADDKLTYRSKGVVEYKTPPHSEGLGTDSAWIQVNDFPISGVAILEGDDVTMLNVRLPSGMKDLTSLIIQQLERERAESPAEK